MEIKNITPQNFHRYGMIIEYPGKETENKEDNLFKVILKETAIVGWRIAYFIIRDKSINRMEQHPESYESFEPVLGRAVLYVANQKDKETIECFYLDRPVILNKYIWHGMVTLDSESEIKITENVHVECVYWPLGYTLLPSVGSLNSCK